MEGPSPLLSIGAVSAATGIPVSTLRTWERRYGWPDPVRTDGHQRLYDASVVDRLRSVAMAIGRGHRAAQVLSAEGAALDALLRSDANPVLETWMAAVAALDAPTLRQGFHREAAAMGVLAFLEQRAAPFLVEVGDAWHAKRILPVHEHLASEQLRDFLSSLWRPMSEDAGGPVALCATLPGEHHVLGLHMAATMLASKGWQVVLVGADTPIDDLAAAATQSGARGVFVSVSGCSPPKTSRAQLAELRRRVPPDVPVIAGGRGAPDTVRGVDAITRLTSVPAAPR